MEGVKAMKGLLRSTLVRVSALLIVVFFAVAFISLKLQNNELSSRLDAINAEIEKTQDSIDAMNAELSEPYDDAYVEKIAREELGLRYPQEIVFYSGEGN